MLLPKIPFFRNKVERNFHEANCKFWFAQVTNGEYLEEKALVVKAEEAKKEAADYFEEKTRNFPQKLTKDYKLNLLEINHKSMELLKQANEHLRI